MARLGSRSLGKDVEAEKTAGHSFPWASLKEEEVLFQLDHHRPGPIRDPSASTPMDPSTSTVRSYKRVNDLLGKGTACRVVENQALLDTMDHLTAKAKEEARKLLNSKHLFFREMCAYHNFTNAASAPPPQMQPPPPPHADQQHLCFHHPPTAVSAGAGKGGATVVEEYGMATHEEDEDDDDDVDSEDDDDEDDDDDEEEDEDETDYHHSKKHRGGGGHRHHQQQQRKREEAEEEGDSKGLVGGPGQAEGTKRARRMFSGTSSQLSLSLSSPSSTSTSVQQLKSELVGMAGEGEQQQRQWLKRRSAELEEQQVGILDLG